MTTSHFIIVDDGLPARDMEALTDEIEQVDGIRQVLSYEKFLGGGVPREVLPPRCVRSSAQAATRCCWPIPAMRAAPKLKRPTGRSERHCQALRPQRRDYRRGCNDKRLIEVADVDFRSVSIASIAAVFLIIAISFRSASIPVLLVAAIESAIMINMGIPYFTGTTLPFVANIVIGTIQLGATVDYAILMTTRFREELNAGRSTKDAVQTAVEQCSQSILTSGLTFFAATFSVSLASRMELISSLCRLISRGALISMLVILLVLPALLILTAPLIRKTTYIGSAKKRRRKPYEKVIAETTAVLVSAALAVTCALPAFAEQPTEGVTKDEMCF